MALKGSWVFLGALLLTTVAALLWPSPLLAPGSLTPGHQALNKNCWACHAALGGVPAERCLACHAWDAAGSASGAMPPATQQLHQRLGQLRCGDCHLEHVTGVAAVVAFDHARLAASPALRCEDCHQQDAPSDGLHGGQASSCSQCHDTGAWRPSRFDHSPYFELDREHAERGCVGCHDVTVGYKSYQCFGCHEHDAAKMLRKHNKEGVDGYSERCADCHASADEHASRSRRPATGQDAPTSLGAPQEPAVERSEKRKKHDKDDD
jgi:hypothetical protein